MSYHQHSRDGYSLIELALVMGIVGILATIAAPSFLSYYQASRLRVAAEEVAAFINEGRQLGIRENAGACVHITSTALQYFLGSSCGTGVLCADAPDVRPCLWTGAGTDSGGRIGLPQGVTLTTNTDPTFSYLGAANPGGAITVTNSQTGAALRVCVAVSGRVSVRSSCS
jgi:prepilin-type N-terminal cleavage/methylation domain-containing protein